MLVIARVADGMVESGSWARSTALLWRSGLRRMVRWVGRACGRALSYWEGRNIEGLLGKGRDSGQKFVGGDDREKLVYAGLRLKEVVLGVLVDELKRVGIGAVMC